MVALMLLPRLASAREVQLPQGVSREAVARLERDARELVADYVRARPRPGSAEEHPFHLRYVEFSAAAASVLRLSFLSVSRENLLAATRSLVDHELATDDAARKFALRQLAQATETAGVVLERVGAALEQVGPAVLDGPVTDAIRLVVAGGRPIEADERSMLRFGLDLSAAFISLDAPLEELTEWALRCAVNGRRVLALLPTFDLVEFRSELVRFRAKRAWTKWSPEDVEQEIAPWAPLEPR